MTDKVKTEKSRLMMVYKSGQIILSDDLLETLSLKIGDGVELLEREGNWYIAKSNREYAYLLGRYGKYISFMSVKLGRSIMNQETKPMHFVAATEAVYFQEFHGYKWHILLLKNSTNET